MWAAPGQTRTSMFISVILVTHPKSYLEKTDRRDFGGKPSKWSENGCYREKFRNFVAWAEPDPKENNIFSRFKVPFDCPAHSLAKQFCLKPMESRDSEGVPFASLESLTRHLADIDPWRMLKSGHLTITKIENLHIDTRRKFTDSKMVFFLIYDEK